MISNFARKAMLCAMPVFVAALSSFAGTQAAAGTAFQYRVLHDYCKAADCADGYYATGTPAMDADGNLYTVSYDGARFGYGALSEIEPRKGGTRYFKHVLKEFCDDDTAECGSGGHPDSGVIMDAQGNLYGTTWTSANKSGCGTVYEIETVTRAAKFKPPVEVLYTFDNPDGCAPAYGSLDYAGKESGQPYDGTSPLFGMTNHGGSQNAGTVYELIPPKPGRKLWTEKVLVNFCNPQAPKGRALPCRAGAFPLGNLVMDASGDVFGETTSGVVFALSPDGSGGFNYNAIYTSNTGEEYIGLLIEDDGTLIGVADGGGPTKGGTLFSLTPPCRACSARDIIYQYTLLHAFCGGGGNCDDGLDPNTVVMDSSGNLFGTTFAGGPNAAPPNSPYTGGGTLFEYSNSGLFFTVHGFCAQTDCADGGAPYGGLMVDNNGNLFGTTAGGGSTVNVKYGAGVLYELSLPPR